MEKSIRIRLERIHKEGGYMDDDKTISKKNCHLFILRMATL